MAKAAFKMPEDFLLKLSRLGEKTDEIIPNVLEAGGEIVEAKVKSNLQAVIGSGTKEESRSTGKLLSALGVSSARQDKDGNFIKKASKRMPFTFFIYIFGFVEPIFIFQCQSACQRLSPRLQHCPAASGKALRAHR